MGNWQDEWEEQAAALSAKFYPEARAAFAFLETTYGYRFLEEKLEWPRDSRETTAMVIFAGERMEVMIGWYFSSGNVFVTFQTPLIPNHLPDQRTEEERRASVPRYMGLYDLARFLGTAGDPDFLLGDVWNVYESKCKKRDALIQSDLRSVLDGLARATERYASQVLKGATSQFADVAVYREAHKDDYWRLKKRKK